MNKRRGGHEPAGYAAPIDPADVYRITGQFDPGSHDDDIQNFPRSFDANGWPLFGEYDRYALHHPISGRPWYEAPRIPARDEEGCDYECWYRLAEEFNS